MFPGDGREWGGSFTDGINPFHAELFFLENIKIYLQINQIEPMLTYDQCALVVLTWGDFTGVCEIPVSKTCVKIADFKSQHILGGIIFRNQYGSLT